MLFHLTALALHQFLKLTPHSVKGPAYNCGKRFLSLSLGGNALGNQFVSRWYVNIYAYTVRVTGLLVPVWPFNGHTAAGHVVAYLLKLRYLFGN
jgi:hypothetical protein